MHPSNAFLQLRLMPTLLVAALALSACNKAPLQAPAPAEVQASTPAAAASAGSIDASVPPAESVLKPGTAVKAEPDAGRANRAMSKAQESGAMPLPGQNNDHSAPLLPAKSASAP